MGVLTISLGDKGTYVINKQAPNRQLWWSSPVSGPRRYAWDAAARKWANTRDGHDMLDALCAEIRQLTGADMAVARGGGGGGRRGGGGPVAQGSRGAGPAGSARGGRALHSASAA